MAAADTACVPARAGTILGVTRSLASPAYRKLERYEPWLRRAVPALLILFLATLAASAWMQARDGRDEAVVDAINDIDVLATLAAVKFGAPPGCRGSGGGRGGAPRAGARNCPPARSSAAGCSLLADPNGKVLSAFPPLATIPAALNDLLGEAQPLTVFADRAGVMTIRFADGEDGIATVRAPARRADRGRAAGSPGSRQLAGAGRRPGDASLGPSPSC